MVLLLLIGVGIQTRMFRDDNGWNRKDFIGGLQGSTHHPNEWQDHENRYTDQEAVHQKICEPMGKSSSSHSILLIRLLPKVMELDESQCKKNDEIQIRHGRGVPQPKVTKGLVENHNTGVMVALMGPPPVRL